MTAALRARKKPHESELSETTATAPETSARPAVRWPVRLVAGLAVVFMLWHVFASFLWIFPPSPFRQLVSMNTLTSYMIPFFGQSWSVFAPEPINGDYHLNVRAVIDKNGVEEETGWVSANRAELSALTNHLFPPRAGIQSEQLASMHREAFLKLEEAQQTILAGDFKAADWEAGMREALLADGKNAVLVDGYLAREHMTTAYATQVAKAVWGDEGEVLRVQYRISRQNVVVYAERNNPDAKRPEPFFVTTGWRSPIVNPGQNEAAFADVFVPLYERSVGIR